ncbi:hypothetical protein HBI95_029230 [Parastagonospora nodorum]|nr:hypothetical protein HBI95_029230 [Parastagonospora nodorum]
MPYRKALNIQQNNKHPTHRPRKIRPQFLHPYVFYICTHPRPLNNTHNPPPQFPRHPPKYPRTNPLPPPIPLTLEVQTFLGRPSKPPSTMVCKRASCAMGVRRRHVSASATSGQAERT